MSQPKLLTDAVGRPLKAADFTKKRADTWYRDSPALIQLVNLQKSDYGLQYYINIALWLKPLGIMDAPQEHHCHVRLRWEALLPKGDEQQAKRLLDLEDTSISEQERIDAIDQLFRKHVLSFLVRVKSLASLADTYRTMVWLQSFVIAKARQLLEGIDSGDERRRE